MQRILAMPGICDSTDFGLSDERTNMRKAVALLRNKKESLWETDTHDFFRTGDWESGGYLVLYNKEEKIISYFVKFDVHNGVMQYRRVVTQVRVWRSDTDTAAKGLAEKVFFDIFLKRYGAVMSDKLQTQAGKRFWIQQMTLAKSRDYQVAFIDQNRRTINVCPESVTMRRWVDSFHTWGSHEKHQGERFMIFEGSLT